MIKPKKVLIITADVSCGYGKPKYPAIGPAYLIACLKEKGISTEMLDLRDKGNDISKLQEYIADYNPDFIGMHITILNMNESKKIHSFIKTEFPKVLTIAGGPQPSFIPADFKEFDFIIKGEGEEALPYLIQNHTTIPKHLPFVMNPKNINTLPFPDWGYFGSNFKTLPIFITRGCPYQCIYCNIKDIFGKTHRERDPQNVIDEIRFCMENFGTVHFEVIDDNFTLIPGYVTRICNAMIESGLKFTWDAVQGVRVDRCTYEEFVLMKKAGCRMIGIGVESGVQNIVNELKRSMDLDSAKQKINDAQRAGLRVKAFFLVGAPGETYNDVMESIRFFKLANIDIPRFGMLVPYQGTELYDIVLKDPKAKFLMTDNSQLTHGLEYGDKVKVAFETEAFSTEEKIDAYKLATKEADTWIIQKRFGQIIGAFAKIDWLRELMKKIYFSSTYLKRVIWAVDDTI